MAREYSSLHTRLSAAWCKHGFVIVIATVRYGPPQSFDAFVLCRINASPFIPGTAVLSSPLQRFEMPILCCAGAGPFIPGATALSLSLSCLSRSRFPAAAASKHAISILAVYNRPPKPIHYITFVMYPVGYLPLVRRAHYLQYQLGRVVAHQRL